MPNAELSAYHPFRSVEARDRYLAHYDAWAESWPIASETKTVHTDHGETFVRIGGPQDGPPLVLLPAMGCHSLMWMPVIEALSEKYRTYAVDDIYGFGRSVNVRFPKSVSEPMAWLDSLFDELGLDDNINLMGMSLGSYFVAEYELHAPDRLASAVLTAPPSTILPMPRSVVMRMSVLAIPALLPKGVGIGPVIRYFYPDASRSDGAPRRMLDEIVADGMLAMHSFGKRPFGCGGPRVLDDDELRDIRVPTLYMVGDHERFCAADAAVSRLNSVAPQIETTIIPGAGHDIIWVQPRVVSERVLRFLGEHRQ